MFQKKISLKSIVLAPIIYSIILSLIVLYAFIRYLILNGDQVQFGEYTFNIIIILAYLILLISNILIM